MTQPANHTPKVGDKFINEWGSEGEMGITEVMGIIKVGDKVEDGIYKGRSILASDNVWYDCFWSDKNKRFQYFHD